MLQMSSNWLTAMTAPSRIVKGKVELYRDSTLIYTFLPSDRLISIQIDKAADVGKLFGYTLCQKVTVEILDKENTITINKGDELRVFLGSETELAKNCYFYVDEFVRDEIKGNISITAYDVINKSSKHLQKELSITYPITLKGYADTVASFLGVTAIWVNSKSFTDIEYPVAEMAPNFTGEETLREVLEALAQATGTICYVDPDNRLCFKHLGAASVLTINKADYFEFKLGDSLSITKVTHATELGDNISAGTDSGFNNIIRDNPFIELRDDAASILTTLLSCVNNLTFYAYELKWRGNPALDIGDTVKIVQQDGTTVSVCYLGESLTYNGGMVSKAEWHPGESEQVDSNPATIGDAIKNTFAKVDKVNNEITLVAASVDANGEAISNLSLDTDGIKASVTEIETAMEEGFDALSGDIQEVSKQASLAMTPEEVKIEISKELSNGVDKVTTSTGFTFNEDGLNISKSTSDITTTITEDGMRVARGGDTVLTANNEGVIAEDLHATTYLIIGKYSRFEDFGSRTGCFWIG